jgi:UDP:flavonoid glycosyltransferase YjiC (YdhE family)
MTTAMHPTTGVRVLFSFSPGIGHLYPLLPLARELRRQGHAVAFLGSSSLGDAVAAEGFELLPAGPGIEALIGAAFARYPELAAMQQMGNQQMRAAIPIFADVRVEITLSEALPAARAWRPDIVVSEHADFVGPLVAAILGAAPATLGFGPGHPAGWLAQAGEAVAPHYAAQGLRPPANGGRYDGLYLDTCPPSLQAPLFPRPAHAQPLRPEAYGRAGAEWTPPDFGDRADRPLILLTMGTIFGNPTVFAAALAGLSALDVNVLVAVGPRGEPGAIAADPARVRMERFVPLDRALDRCDLVVAHGGAGTILAALVRGIPLVVIPQGADQFINAERAVAAGAALSIAPADFNSDALRAAVERVRGDRSYAAAAARIRDEVAAMPSAAEVAAALVAGARATDVPWAAA